MGMERTLAFLNDTFRQFYSKNQLAMLPGFQKREFGFMYHGETYFRRHLGFASPDLLLKDIVARAPAHIYHSAAYYESPSAHTMLEKGWQGADLIFDLDADHLEGADRMSYPQMLDAVKERFLRLVDGFLIGELGYTEEDLYLVFSGSRGYHAHIRDPRVRMLNSVARRQLVDYITKNVPVNVFVKQRPVERVGFRVVKAVRIPRVDEGGWRGRLARANYDDLKTLAADLRPVEDKAKEFAKRTGVGLREARLLVDSISGDSASSKDRLRRLAGGLADLHEGVGVQTFTKLFVYHLGQLRGWCDEPVSSDVKRLIRAPGSLHGKTGLRAVPLTRDRLDAFDPLEEAVALGDEPVGVQLSKPFKMRLGGHDFDLAPGAHTLPTFAAVFVITRRHALLEGDTPPGPPAAAAPTTAAAGGEG